MKKWTIGVMAAATVLLLSAAAPAQVVLASQWTSGDVGTTEATDTVDVEKVGVDTDINVGDKYDYEGVDKYADGCACQDSGKYGKGGKGGKGGGRGGLLACSDVYFDIELQFMRYFQEGGVTDQIGAPAQYNWEFTPRMELGVVGPNGLGFRLRYWDYDGSAVSAAGNPIGVEAYYVDAELFQTYDLACHSSLEVSLGVRYADFNQFVSDLGPPSAVLGSWQGWGGTLAAEARRRVLWGDIYARGRFSVLMGDAAVVNVDPFGVTPFFAEGNTVTQTELAIGYEVSGCVGPALLSGRIGAEWQNWSNVAIADNAFGGVGNDDVLEDAGWAGLVIGFGIQI